VESPGAFLSPAEQGAARGGVRVGNTMTDVAEDLGAVAHAQLIDGNTGCTPR